MGLKLQTLFIASALSAVPAQAFECGGGSEPGLVKMRPDGNMEVIANDLRVYERDGIVLVRAASRCSRIGDQYQTDLKAVHNRATEFCQGNTTSVRIESPEPSTEERQKFCQALGPEPSSLRK